MPFAVIPCAVIAVPTRTMVGALGDGGGVVVLMPMDRMSICARS